MSEAKVYFLDEARDAIAKAKREFIDGKDEELIYNMVNCLVKGGMPSDTIKAYIHNVAILCDPITETIEISDMIDRCIKMCCENKKEISMAQEIRDFIACRQGDVIKSSEVDREFNLSSRVDKKNRSKIMERLVSDGFLERYGKKGEFRSIDRSLEIINWEKAKGEEFNIYFPFGLNDLVKIYPKNVIIIAGTSNAGKTALLLNIVGMNVDRYWNKIRYMSSEMSDDELSMRLLSFGLGKDPWRGCEFVVRSKDFQDLVEPDKINIIDYLEKHEDFYGVGGDIKNIYDKLDKGIAIIALQKGADSDTGTGGRFTKEKPRLYLAVDEKEDGNKIKIVKGKSWRTKRNPNGLVKDFRIQDSYKFIELSDWYREIKKK